MRVCEICKANIEADRVDAMPDTRLCAKHGREIAEYGGEFVVTAARDRTSKQGSLKLNYGGISTSKSRNMPAIERLRDEFERQQFGES